MRRPPEPELNRSQQSIFYYSDLAGREDPVLRARPDYFRQSYTHMLIEDVAASIMPIGGRSQNRPFRVLLTPADPKVEELIEGGIAHRDYNGDLAESVCDFFHECAQTIMAFGEAVYEIVYLSKPSDGTIVRFELGFIQPRTVMHRRGKLVQYVPLEAARRLNVPQYVQLLPERVLTFKPPAYVNDKLEHIMKCLSFLSTHMLPDFALPAMAGEIKSIPYDSSVFLRSQKLALADAGKLIGWNARGIVEGEVLEYYWLHRQLIFERFKIELRDTILRTLNEGLELAGRDVGFSGQLKFEGLPTLDDVKDAEAHLAAGDMPFKEVLKPFLTV